MLKITDTGRRRFWPADPWFVLHWVTGLLAGLVLCVIGVTGGLLSFQPDILAQLNPARTARLTIDTPRPSPFALARRYEAAQPGTTVDWLYWQPSRAEPLALSVRRAGQRRGKRVSLDPLSGAELGSATGRATFGLIRHLHQRLAAGPVGKLLVGLSTLTLVALTVSGLWIRWRRRPRRRWRWLWPKALGGKLAGEWHAVLGLWFALAYLLAALTGLWWSFHWYRDGAKALLTPAHEPAPPTLAVPQPDINAPAIWQRLGPRLADARSVFVRLSRQPDAPLAIRVVPARAAHQGAADTWYVAPDTGRVLAMDRYAAKPVNGKLLESVYALHMGAFFGTPGVVAMMVASLGMPVFFVTGVLLFFRRQRMKRQVAAPALGAPVSSQPDTPDAVLVVHASQSGLAQRIAAGTAAALAKTGQAVRLAGLGELSLAMLAERQRAVFVVSTHGEGDAPVSARAFDAALRSGSGPSLSGLDYALLSLGDTGYGSTYCAFGRRLDRALRQRGATPLRPAIEMNRANPAALTAWQTALDELYDAELTLPAAAQSEWRLVERTILNPASRTPVAWLKLSPVSTSARRAAWQAGDIVDIRPRQNATDVQAWLAHHAGDRPATESAALLLATLATRELPATPGPTRLDQTWAEALPSLAVRSYSIANRQLQHDGTLELLVRLVRHEGRYGPAGQCGLASGWLVERAALGATFALQLRANPGFRAEDSAPDRPAIFIGNGSGLAGLRAHLQTRIAQARHENWLLFGERHQTSDFFFADEITGWLDRGELRHLDTAFSRDGGGYVQQALARRADRLRAWIAAGAVVYVCGSRFGMAPGVLQVLEDTLGAPALRALEASARLRMDVY